MDWLAEAVAKAADAAPMPTYEPVPVIPGRVLLVDGDYLAYFSAGNDDTEPGRARNNVLDRINLMRDLSGSEKVVVHMTASESTKGDRFIISTVKPYQGQRGGRKPKNWRFLRDFLETYTGTAFTTKMWGQREADDGIAYHSKILGPDLAVIATADKDMRMLDGWHIDWKTLQLTHVNQQFEVIGANGLTYGHKWFWLQLLQGDSADNIPGLPKYVVNGTEKLIGPATAEKMLAEVTDDEGAAHICEALYASYYTSQYAARVAEQAALLWLRRDSEADVADCAMYMPFSNGVKLAFEELRQRIHDAKEAVK